MKTIVSIYLLFIIGAISISCGSSRRVINRTDTTLYPVEYGILETRTGAERYNILYECHKKAVEKGYNVSYKGIDELELEIPDSASPIPLTPLTDFAGANIKVVNTSKNTYLFQMTKSIRKVDVKGIDIDNGNFQQYSALNNGKILLIIKDRAPWVNSRKGYAYGATRMDIMIVNKGESKTKPVRPYFTETSDPECQYCSVGNSPIVFKNILFERSKSSTKITHLVNIDNQANVTLSKVKIKTPEGHNLFGDAAITISNVANLTLQDMIIEGTYSQKNKYGYGIYLNNILNLLVMNLNGYADWGVFGNNNINCAKLSNCNINRFDIHCYGRDVSFSNCNFENLYNQFSSIYGKVMFKKCTFTNFTPVLIESSYNAYTPFDLVWEDCVFNFDSKHNCLLNLMELTQDRNPRQEVKRKCIPNIYIKNCVINATSELKSWNIIETGKVNYSESLDYIQSIYVSGLVINAEKLQMRAFSQEVKTTFPLKVKTSRIKFKKSQVF